MKGIYGIIAVAANGVIGDNSKPEGLPWPRIKEDMETFKALTKGHVVVMGRKTFKAMGRTLPGRKNVILSKTLEPGEGYHVARNIEELLALREEGKHMWIIGGAEVIKSCAHLMDSIVVSHIQQEVEGDTKLDIKAVISRNFGCGFRLPWFGDHRLPHTDQVHCYAYPASHKEVGLESPVSSDSSIDKNRLS